MIKKIVHNDEQTLYIMMKAKLYIMMKKNCT